MTELSIRRAIPEDTATLTDFNREMARETEAINLIPEVILAGVQTLLANPEYGYYVVAEIDDQIAGSLLVTTEWSDWRNGIFWWIQSVYVREAYRRRGVYRALYEFVKNTAADDASVCGFRLYVENENTTAQSTYRALGMEETRYKLYEELKPAIRYRE